MNRLVFAGLLAWVAGCNPPAQDWPDRVEKSPPEALLELVTRTQRRLVPASTGVYEYNAFSDSEYATFMAENQPSRAATGLRTVRQFREMVGLLGTLPHDQLVTALRTARRSARPTYAMFGSIDPAGRAQTDAGRAAELRIAEAVTDVLAIELGVSVAEIAR
jgi:hypothetical protein